LYLKDRVEKYKIYLDKTKKIKFIITKVPYFNAFVVYNIIVCFTHRNTTDYELTEDQDNLLNAPFILNASIKLLIHGYTGDQNYSPNTELRPGNVTIILYLMSTVKYI
jgi:hypothetical protein